MPYVVGFFLCVQLFEIVGGCLFLLFEIVGGCLFLLFEIVGGCLFF
jgi:hypothetical protein